MLTFVLTGGLGAGKTTAARYFEERGAVVVSLDDVAHRVLDRGTAELARVVDEFGPAILADDGSLDARALADLAFESPQAAARLNAIVHPAVAREVGPALRELDMLPIKPQVVALEVPLLVEAPVYRELADVVLAISVPRDMRVARCIARGMDPADVSRRIACQASDEERAALADDVIVNDGGPERFREELERFWERHTAVAGGAGR